jgi:hypothetical protein
MISCSCFVFSISLLLLLWLLCVYGCVPFRGWFPKNKESCLHVVVLQITISSYKKHANLIDFIKLVLKCMGPCFLHISGLPVCIAIVGRYLGGIVGRSWDGSVGEVIHGGGVGRGVGGSMGRRAQGSRGRGAWGSTSGGVGVLSGAGLGTDGGTIRPTKEDKNFPIFVV